MPAPTPLPSSSVDLSAALSGIALFGDLGDDCRAAVAAASRAYACRPGDLVFGAGEKADALYVVLEGAVAVHAGNDEGAPVLASFGKGDVFGELELMEGGARSAAARAEEKAVLLRFPRRGLAFESFVKANPKAASRALRGFLITLSSRIREANALVKENSPWVRELRRQAYADKLTGLNNKAFLEEKAAELCAVPGARAALLMFKPDNFKDINDSYGHEAGDETLRLEAEAFGRAYGPEAFTARYMGNELALLMGGAGRAEAEAEGRKLLALVSGLDLSGLLGAGAPRLSASVGIALFPDHAPGGAALVAAAKDLPLAGRAAGGNRLVFPEDLQ